MPNRPPGQRCAVPGCNSWSVRGQSYCAPHLRQWQDNLTLGISNPEPRLIGREHRRCAIRSCRNLAIPNSPYCAFHSRELQSQPGNLDSVAKEFAAMLSRLDQRAPDNPAVLQRELDMLDSARKIFIAHAEMSSRSGWKAISPMTFIRLWLSSATTVTDVTKALFLMENATSADVDRLLSGVYSRIERGPLPTQTPLPLPSPPPNLSGLSPEPQQRLATPEDQLAEWLIEANATLGTPTVLQAIRAYASESALDHNLAHAVLILGEALPSRLPELSPSPTALCARLTTLAEIMQQSPNLDLVRHRLAVAAPSWRAEVPHAEP